MTAPRHPAPLTLRRCGLEYAQTTRPPEQTLHLSPKTLALLLGDELRRIAAQLAQRRKQGGSSS